MIKTTTIAAIFAATLGCASAQTHDPYGASVRREAMSRWVPFVEYWADVAAFGNIAEGCGAVIPSRSSGRIFGYAMWIVLDTTQRTSEFFPFSRDADGAFRARMQKTETGFSHGCAFFQQYPDLVILLRSLSNNGHPY